MLCAGKEIRLLKPFGYIPLLNTLLFSAMFDVSLNAQQYIGYQIATPVQQEFAYTQAGSGCTGATSGTSTQTLAGPGGFLLGGALAVQIEPGQWNPVSYAVGGEFGQTTIKSALSVAGIYTELRESYFYSEFSNSHITSTISINLETLTITKSVHQLSTVSLYPRYLPCTTTSDSPPVTTNVTLIPSESPLKITTDATLPAATLGTVYSAATAGASIAATGGSPPYQWTVSAFSLPEGLTLQQGTPKATIAGTLAKTSEDTAGRGFDTTARQFSFNLTVTDSKGATAIRAFTIPLNCGDERDDIINQYKEENSVGSLSGGLNPFPLNPGANAQDGIQPYCALFTRNYPQLIVGSGASTWGLVRLPLTIPYAVPYAPVGLSTWIAEYNKWADAQPENTAFTAPRQISSAYRTPATNANTPGHSASSRHVFGDAVDLQTISHLGQNHDIDIKACPDNSSEATKQLCAEWTAMKEAAQRAGAYKPTGFIESLKQSRIGHVHADWRGVPGAFQK